MLEYIAEIDILSVVISIVSTLVLILIYHFIFVRRVAKSSGRPDLGGVFITTGDKYVTYEKIGSRFRLILEDLSSDKPITDYLWKLSGSKIMSAAKGLYWNTTNSLGSGIRVQLYRITASGITSHGRFEIDDDGKIKLERSEDLFVGKNEENQIVQCEEEDALKFNFVIPE